MIIRFLVSFDRGSKLQEKARGLTPIVNEGPGVRLDFGGFY